VVEIDVPVGPQPPLDLFARHQLAGPLEQEMEQVDSLTAQPDRLPASSEEPAPIVKLKVSERFHHGQTPIASGSRLRSYTDETLRGRIEGL
jgi:hypothetical protein